MGVGSPIGPTSWRSVRYAGASYSQLGKRRLVGAFKTVISSASLHADKEPRGGGEPLRKDQISRRLARTHPREVSRYVGAYTYTERSAIRCCDRLGGPKLDMGRGEDPESSQARRRVGEDRQVGVPDTILGSPAAGSCIGPAPIDPGSPL